MRLSIIPSDGSVYVDGSGYINIDLSWIPEIDGKKIHAVQWLDDEGEIEFVGSAQNMKINDLGIFEQAISLWNEKKEEEEAFLKRQLELEERRKREEEERLKSQFITFDDFDEEYGLDIEEFTELDEKPYIPPTPTHIPPVEPPLAYKDTTEEDEDEDLFYDIEELLKEI
jgi:hypothetical protein